MYSIGEPHGPDKNSIAVLVGFDRDSSSWSKVVLVEFDRNLLFIYMKLHCTIGQYAVAGRAVTPMH